MPCPGFIMFPGMSLVPSQSAGVGLCSNEAVFQTFLQAVNSNLQLIVKCIEDTFGDTVNIPGVPGFTLNVPGFTVPGLTGFDAQYLKRIPPLGRSFIGDVLPTRAGASQSRGKFTFPNVGGTNVAGTGITIPGIDPLDKAFEMIKINYDVIIKYLADEQGITIEPPKIPVGTAACTGALTGQPGASTNALATQQQGIDEINRLNGAISNAIGVPPSTECVSGSTGLLPILQNETTGGCWDTGAVAPFDSDAACDFDSGNRILIIDALSYTPPPLSNQFVFAESHPTGETTGEYPPTPCMHVPTVGEIYRLTVRLELLETTAAPGDFAAGLEIAAIALDGSGYDFIEVVDQRWTVAELASPLTVQIQGECPTGQEISPGVFEPTTGILGLFTTYRQCKVKFCNVFLEQL